MSMIFAKNKIKNTFFSFGEYYKLLQLIIDNGKKIEKLPHLIW